MRYSTAVPRLALWKVALSLGAVAGASLAIASGASAAVIVVTPDNTSGTDNLTAAINTANTNSDPSNTIVLTQLGGAGRYVPKSPITISKNLTITGSHAAQAVPGQAAYQIDGSQQSSANPGNLFTINSGVTLTLEGFQLSQGGSTGFAQILDNGNLVSWGVNFGGAPGAGINVAAGGTATLNQSTVASAIQDEIDDSGSSLTLNNVTMADGQAIAIDDKGGGPITLNNSVLAAQVGAECVGFTSQNGGPGSMDDDGTCGVQHSNDPNVDAAKPAVAGSNGGPSFSYQFAANSPTVGAGVSSLCPTTDQRFFVNPAGGSGHTCDIGSVTNSASQETAAQAGSTPSTGALTCTVSAVITGPPKQQQVTVTDTLSGLGLEAGSATDPQPGTPSTPGDNTPVGPPFGTSPGDTITNLFISNGSVAFTPFAAPSNSGLVLTATKTNQSSRTSWNFTATNWAGNSKACN